MDPRKLTLQASRLAAAASRGAELTTLETITLPTLHHKIGIHICRHKKLPPDLEQQRANIAALQSKLVSGADDSGEESPGATARLKRIADHAVKAASKASTSMSLQAAYVSLGKHAVAKYGTKVIPTDVLPAFEAAQSRVAELRRATTAATGSMTVQPVKDDVGGPTAPVSPSSEVAPPLVVTRSAPRRSLSRRVRRLGFGVMGVTAIGLAGVIMARAFEWPRAIGWGGVPGMLRPPVGREGSPRDDARTSDAAEVRRRTRQLEEETKQAEARLAMMRESGATGSNLWEHMAGVAKLYFDQKKYDRAITLLNEAVAGFSSREDTFSGEQTVTCLGCLAETYEMMGRYPPAEEARRRAVATSERIHGPNTRRTAHALNALAGSYEKAGRYAQAEEVLQRAISIVKNSVSADDPDQAIFLCNLAALHERTSSFEKAEQLYRESLSLLDSSLPEDSPLIALGLNRLSGFYRKQQRFEEAEPLLARALTICEKTVGPDHPDAIKLREAVSEVRKRQGKKP